MHTFMLICLMEQKLLTTVSLRMDLLDFIWPVHNQSSLIFRVDLLGGGSPQGRYEFGSSPAYSICSFSSYSSLQYSEIVKLKPS